jgi:hypothetical protein
MATTELTHDELYDKRLDRIAARLVDELERHAGGRDFADPGLGVRLLCQDHAASRSSSQRARGQRLSRRPRWRVGSPSTGPAA